MFSLRWKILLWFFVNLLVLSMAIFWFLRAQLRLDINSLVAGPTSDRLEVIAAPLAAQLHERSRDQWSTLLAQSAGRWRSSHVLAGLFRDDGTYLAGDIPALPEEVRRLIESHERRHHGPLPWHSDQHAPANSGWASLPNRGVGSSPAANRPGPPVQPPRGGYGRREPPPPDDEGGPPPPPDDFFDPAPGSSANDNPPPDRPGASDPVNNGQQPLTVGPFDKFLLRTGQPLRYWVGVHLGEMEVPTTTQSPSVTLVFASDSLRGGGLLFDWYPWLAFALVLVVLSVLIWLPFVAGVIRSLSRMVCVSEEVAQGRFEASYVSRRRDELGRLSRALRHMGIRLEEAATGQKRFLGDTAHELLSPLARLEMTLSILEQHPDPTKHQMYTVQALDEVHHTTELVRDLLAFAKAGLRAPQTELVSVRLIEAVESAVAREAASEVVSVEVSSSMYVRADSELLTRALCNGVRNAVRYAGHAGPIRISATAGQDTDGEDRITLDILDQGPGVPPDSLNRLLEPFFRPEVARTRETGGSGLGLAIVKSCVEACGGNVSVHNRLSGGFQLTFILRPAARPH